MSTQRGRRLRRGTGTAQSRPWPIRLRYLRRLDPACRRAATSCRCPRGRTRGRIAAPAGALAWPYQGGTPFSAVVSRLPGAVRAPVSALVSVSVLSSSVIAPLSGMHGLRRAGQLGMSRSALKIVDVGASAAQLEHRAHAAPPCARVWVARPVLAPATFLGLLDIGDNVTPHLGQLVLETNHLATLQTPVRALGDYLKQPLLELLDGLVGVSLVRVQPWRLGHAVGVALPAGRLALVAVDALDLRGEDDVIVSTALDDAGLTAGAAAASLAALA